MSIASETRTEAGLPADIALWIEEVSGGRLVDATRQPGGGRREAWSIDVEYPDGSPGPLFLRRDSSDPSVTGDPFTLQREAKFYAALQDSDVPVPRLIGSHPTEQALLCSRVSGSPGFSRLTVESERVSIASDFMAKLAALHRVDPASVDLGSEPNGSLQACVRHEIAKWETMYRFGGAAEDPLIEFGLAWLWRNIPDVEIDPVIVQGDTGPGNFLFLDGKVSAVLDWELAHLGDPMEDLGWLALRAVQDPFTVFTDRLADYSRFSGIEVDLDRLRYYRLFAELKVVILGHRRTESHRARNGDLTGEIGNVLIYETLHRKLFAEALLEAYQACDQRYIELTGEPSEREWVYDAMLAQIKDVIVPLSTDPFVVLRSKGLARMAKYLKAADRYGADADEQEIASLEATLGITPTSVRDGRAKLARAVRSGSIPAPAMLAYISGRVRRDVELMRPSMGALAERRHDPLSV